MMAEKTWITSDLSPGHTALWDPHETHGKSGLRLRGGEVREVEVTPHIEAQLKEKDAPIRKATDKEVEAVKAQQRQDKKEAAAAAST